MTATTVHETFEDQARRTPNATALWSDGEPTSYAALDAAADRIAALVGGLGARRGELVGIHLERGVDQVAAVLGVLKAGAGFVMLDTTFPTPRLRSQIADTAPVVVLSTRHLAAGLGDPSAPVVYVDDPRPDTGSGHEAAAELPAGPDDLACVMFTSGSTGRPKAVAGNHRSLLISVSATTFGHFGSGETVVQAAPVSWDAFVLELFGALLFGGAVVLQPGQSPDPAVIADLVRRHRVTTLFASAGLLAHLIDEHPEIFTHLGRVLTGGDTASPAHLARLLRRHPDLRLVNGYGPVETMIAATTHQVSVTDTEGVAIPVGRDTPGKRVEILDADLRPVSAGETGEIYISGAGLADGYLRQAGTTATRFVARPGGAAGERMYRTGDLGRRRADGVVEFLGRRDAQVKVRGFRIELGEIESALSRHAGVRRAAATVHDSPGGGALVGYVVPAPGRTVDVAELRDHLRSVLPRHAVPAQVVVLPELPATANGKLDRRALPAPDLRSAAPRPAGSEEERTLCGLFAELLGVPGIGVDDDFFELGGHSLLAARLVNRVRTRLGRELDLRTVFAAPTVAGLARRLGPATSRPPLEAAVRPEAIPLSPGQERMWFGYQTTSTRAGFHVGRTFDLRGPLDAAALGRAVADVVARHEALRTVYPVGPSGRPRQQVLGVDRIELPLPPVPLDPSDLEAAVDGLIGSDFDLATELPIRVRLFSLGPEHAVLVLVLHHIACDGWSMVPLLRDLATAYTARCRGVAPEAAPLPVQYADFAAWQRDVWQGPTMESALAHWTSVLAGLPEESGLPATRSRPTRPGRRGELVEVRIDADLHRAVVDLAQDSQTTVFMIIHAALAVLLARLGAGPDLALGTPVAARADEALDDLIGFFVNTVVLRTDTSGDPSVRTLLARVRDADLDAYAHGEVPFERVVDAVKPDRRADRHPLFQVMLAVRDEEPPLRLPRIETTTTPVHPGVAQFEITVDLVERHDPTGRPAGVRGDLEYATDLYDRAFVEALAERLPRVLRAMVSDPGLPLSRIDVLADHERKQLTHDWRGSCDPTPAVCLHDLVGEQIARTPDAVAVTEDDRRLTYAELGRRSAGLAAALRSAGVGQDRIVAVVLPRSAALVVALLAVLRAGGAFLIVDPSEPDPRTASMVAETAPVCAVVGQDSAPPGLPAGLVQIPVTADGERGRTTTAPPPPSGPDDAAYVVFTSGSTGAPKGVVVPHGAIVNCLRANRRWEPLSTDDRVLFKAAVTFDVAVREVFWPLVQGATIVVAAPGGQRDPGYLADLVRRESITTVDFVPSMLPAFLDLHPATYPALRRITCGGEALPPALARRVHDVLGIAVQNFYGPTEAAVEVTTWPWSPAETEDTGSVPIGRPGINTGVLVLDQRLEPSPVGTIGELYLSGTQLARGYLGRPGLTAERFVADPHGPAGARLYRTGDRGRWRPDGVLEFAGRDDGQVKVNGRRIELGEIEAALRSHPAVSDGVVTDTEHRPGDIRLTAYAVPRAGASLDPAELRAHLSRALPRPLVPAVVVLDALPLTRHGKLDRAALPAAADNRTALRREPGSPQERALCGLFAKVLGTTDVGVDDSFFDLGGHSLLATRVISQARAALGVEIDIAALFEFPTPAGLAAHLTHSPPARPALRPRPTAEENLR